MKAVVAHLPEYELERGTLPTLIHGAIQANLIV